MPRERTGRESNSPRQAQAGSSTLLLDDVKTWNRGVKHAVRLFHDGEGRDGCCGWMGFVCWYIYKKNSVVRGLSSTVDAALKCQN